MPTSRDTIDGLLQELNAAAESYGEGDFRAGRARLERAEEQAAELGLESAYLTYMLADSYRAAKDTEGFERGFELSCKAVQLDPLQPAHAEQFTFFAEQLRVRLNFHSRFPTTKSAPRLYETLLRAGEADAKCHVSMARYLIGAERFDEAKRLLDATVLLEPGHREAWVTQGELARRTGREADAKACEARAAELEATDAPFGVPTPDARC